MIQKTWKCLLSALIAICPLAVIPSNSSAIADTNLQSKEPSNSVLSSTLKVGESRSQSIARPDSNAIAKIFTYKIGDKPAATVYVRNLPVLTFIGSNKINQKVKNLSSELSSKLPSNRSKSTLYSSVDPSVDPIERATATAALFNQLSRDGFDANNIIAVRKSNAYVIKLGSQMELKLDSSLIIPNSSKNKANSALEATNLLRRLIGNAQPLAKVEGIKVEGIKVSRVIKPSYRQPIALVSQVITGMASWYGPGFHGGTTANGERFNQYKYTAAHPNLPFGTPVRVTNMYNGRSVVVRINDRGPYSGGRVIDLSKRAAQTIGLISSGVARVRLEVIRR